MSIQEAYRFFNELRLTPVQGTVADKVLEEIRSRLRYLYKVGLEYLTLDRLASTLSGGESQRIQLATAWARTWSAHSMSSMSLPLACTRATPDG